MENCWYQEKGPHPQPSSGLALFYSITSVGVGLPFLVGSWCWPVILAVLFATVASKSAILLSHSLQFACLLAVFTNLLQYTFYLCSVYRSGHHFAQYGPTYVCCGATSLILFHPTCLVLVDANVIQSFNHQMANVAAWSGYSALLVSTLWIQNVFPRMRKNGWCP